MLAGKWHLGYPPAFGPLRSGYDEFFLSVHYERERANRGPREPARLQAMRADWLAWNATMPPIPDDASVSLGYGAKDMPQR